MRDSEERESTALRLMAITAHPDDESLGFGGVLARYAAEGVETYVVTATRGERGWFGDPRENPGMAALGRIREGELRAACRELGVRRLALLGYIDGELDQADPREAIAKIAECLREIRPHVVLTFGPDGAYGHPDHIAICQFTTAAIVRAADPGHVSPAGHTPHAVAKLYYMEDTAEALAVYQSVFGDLVMHIDGVERRGSGWPEWEITTRIATADYWPTVWRAVSCHRTQLPGYAALAELPEEQHRALWGSRGLYRALSTMNGGREREDDVFAGLR
jgi:LmbE family N-acetylglucosaminyl deacetylase